MSVAWFSFFVRHGYPNISDIGEENISHTLNNNNNKIVLKNIKSAHKRTCSEKFDNTCIMFIYDPSHKL